MALTQKQDAFAQAFIENGGNRSEAYRSAYSAENMKPETVNKRASELMQKGEVAGRIQKLQEALAKKHEITVERIRDMLLEDRELARKEGKVSAAVAASMGLAKIYGFGTEKHSHNHTHTHEHTVEEVSEEERRNMLADRIAEGLARRRKDNPPEKRTAN